MDLAPVSVLGSDSYDERCIQPQPAWEIRLLVTITDALSYTTHKKTNVFSLVRLSAMYILSILAVVLSSLSLPNDDNSSPEVVFVRQLSMGGLFGIITFVQLGSYGIFGKGMRPLLEQHAQGVRIRVHFFIVCGLSIFTVWQTLIRTSSPAVTPAYRFSNLLAIPSMLGCSCSLALLQVLPIKVRKVLANAKNAVLQGDFVTAMQLYDTLLELEQEFKPVFENVALPVAALAVLGSSFYGSEILKILKDARSSSALFEKVTSLFAFNLCLLWISAIASLVPREHARFARLVAKTSLRQDHKECQPLLTSLALTQECVGFRLVGQLVRPGLLAKCVTIGSVTFRAATTIL